MGINEELTDLNEKYNIQGDGIMLEGDGKVWFKTNISKGFFNPELE
jgi:hypothetical protein